MNLTKFITTHQEIGDIAIIKRGMESSPFTQSINDISELVKEILKKLLAIKNDEKMYSQSTNGGIQPNATLIDDSNNRKQSYCIEFPQMLKNILGLIGFEFSYCITTISSINRILNDYIQKISPKNDSIESYLSLKNLIITIKNIYSLGNGNSLQISNHFKSHFINNDDDSIKWSNFSTDSKLIFFDNIIEFIDYKISKDVIINFIEDKQSIYLELENLYKNTIFTKYTIDNVDQLCLSMHNIKPCYDGYFIKEWEILYLETFADTYKLIHPSKHKISPVIDYLTNVIQLDLKAEKYLTNFKNYLIKIYKDTISCLYSDDSSKRLDIIITQNMYEYMSYIILNLYINISKKIASNQECAQLFGKSTRIQFAQVFQALKDSISRLHQYCQSQSDMLHYILIPKKTLSESINNLNAIKSKK